jgi:pantothenate kinase
VHLSPDGSELVDLAAALDSRAARGRWLLGLAGPPGAGKSTVARAVVERLHRPGVVVPMDGFHLADVELARQGLGDRKGAPESFDGWGYAALLARLRQRPDHVVYAPGFERTLEQPIAGAVPVEPAVDVVLTEGNYLLLDRPEWQAGRNQLDECWYVDIDPALRVERLVARHVAFGKSEAAARSWVDRVDSPNALLVEESRDRADLVIGVTEWTGR